DRHEQGRQASEQNCGAQVTHGAPPNGFQTPAAALFGKFIAEFKRANCPVAAADAHIDAHAAVHSSIGPRYLERPQCAGISSRLSTREGSCRLTDSLGLGVSSPRSQSR